MINKIINDITDKNIAILGFGIEGKSTYNFIRRYLPNEKLIIIDESLNKSSLNDENVTIINNDWKTKLNNFDIIFKTPGISLLDIETNNIKDKITSQLQILLKHFDNLSIGITGSKGKSTTASLTHQILIDQGKDAYLLGNIGNPPLDYIEKFNKDTIFVIEMAVYQLEYMTYSPKIAAILNFYEEHLDFFGTIENYYNSKLNIFNYQNKNDIAIYNGNNETLINYIQNTKFKSNLLEINKNNNQCKCYIKDNYIYIDKQKIFDINTKTKLLGSHNLENIMFALTISNLLNLNLDQTIKTIKDFNGLENRMEMYKTHNHITFYSDTIATIPEATINCIKALKNVNTLIFGGKDRGIDYEDFINFLNQSEIENFICMPDTGTKIGKCLINKNVLFLKDMKEVVEKAYKITKKDTICLLSPAAASYNKYKSFTEKGEDYKKCIDELK